MRFDHFADQELDLFRFDVRYKNDVTSARAYPPAMLLKVVLFAYSRSLVGLRGIERACRDHVTLISAIDPAPRRLAR